MSETDRKYWNHPHWDHGAPATEPPRESHLAAWLYARLDRAHLPHHPAAPAALVALGLIHCLVVGRLFVDVAGGNRALLVATALIGALAVLPGALLVLAGAWDLARGPLRYRAGRFVARERSRH